MKPSNLISNRPPRRTSGEIFDELVSTSKVTIERIVSDGHSSPEGFWYDQPRDEWVMVLQGSAGLLVEGNAEAVKLTAGDWLVIPAHKKHRVEWTDSSEQTIWLAVHYESP